MEFRAPVLPAVKTSEYCNLDLDTFPSWALCLLHIAVCRCLSMIFYTTAVLLCDYGPVFFGMPVLAPGYHPPQRTDVCSKPKNSLFALEPEAPFLCGKLV